MTKNQVNTYQPVTFLFDGDRPVRQFEVDGKTVFAAKDVVEALGNRWNGTIGINHVPERWKGVRLNLTPGGKQQLAYLTREGVNFYVCRSDSPKAIPFQEWLAGEVLPAIDAQGFYIRPDKLNEFVSVLEASRCVSHTERTIRRRISSGDIETRQGDNRIEVSMSSLLEHLRENPIRRRSRTIQPQAGEVTVNVTALSCANQILVNALVEQLAEAQGSAT